MRLNKFLSYCGVASRRKCDQLIAEGKVSVNGEVVRELGTIVKKDDLVKLEGRALKIEEEFVYLKLNKPKGYISSSSDEKRRKTIFDLIKTDKRLFSIGRLDYNTEGLILLTNDGHFAQLVSHPSFEIEKEYVVHIEGRISESELAVLRAGVVENGERMPKARVTPIKFDGRTTRVSVVINEGQNHQVRRMFKSIDKTVTLLRRVRIGSIKLGNLSRGATRTLSNDEINSILLVANTETL